MIRNYTLAKAASTGNNTHTAAAVNEDAEAYALEFVVEAVGATPTVTFSFQGSVDGTNFDALPLITPGTNDTIVAGGATVTAVGRTRYFVHTNHGERFFKHIRVVTSANTNVTYSASLVVKAEL